MGNWKKLGLRGGLPLLAITLLAGSIALGPSSSIKVVAQSITQAALYPQRQRNLDEIASIAAKIETDSGFPAEVLIAQWAIESDWGDHPACSNNFFGIKRSSRHKLGCVARTREAYSPHQVDAWAHDHPNGPSLRAKPAGNGMVTVEMEQKFADYASLEDSCKDYAWLIENSQPYARAWAKYQKNRDAKQLLADLAGIYWTDPGYVAKAKTVIDDHDVATALAAARTHGTPSAPVGPTALTPATLAGIAFSMGGLVISLVAWGVRAQNNQRHQELSNRFETIRSEMTTSLAQAETRFQDRARNSLTDVLRGNNADLVESLDARYLRAQVYEERHKEILAAIKKTASSQDNNEVAARVPVVPPLAGKAALDTATS